MVDVSGTGGAQVITTVTYAYFAKHKDQETWVSESALFGQQANGSWTHCFPKRMDYFDQTGITSTGAIKLDIFSLWCRDVYYNMRGGGGGRGGV